MKRFPLAAVLALAGAMAALSSCRSREERITAAIESMATDDPAKVEQAQAKLRDLGAAPTVPALGRALTHADPDHAAGAEALREGHGVEVIVGPGGGRYLPYLVREVASGTLIDQGDVPIRVVGTPGPAPEHLAFVIGEGRFAVTGDLDGRRGARSIPAPPDERAWQRSVADLTSAAPDAVWLDGHPSLDSGA